MGHSGLFVWFFVLNVAHCLEIMGLVGERIHENITAVLGEDVYLSCTYVGESEIQDAEWKRQINSKMKSKRLAGFFNGEPFSRDGISKPDSLTNLTVKMKVSSVEVEGEYICEFEAQEEPYYGSVHLTVVARPDIQMLVKAETINGSHYQSVSCSAAGGRPRPQISWLVAGLPPSHDPFAVEVSESVHSNGTYTVSSILRFPTHLQDEDSVTCVVHHQTLPEPKLTSARVETYTRPNVSVKAEMVQKGGVEFWVVSCISSGGRPDADIALALDSGEELQGENVTNSHMQTSSVLLPVTVYEGHNITCAFDHPKFTHHVTRVIALPSFYLSEVGSDSDDLRAAEPLELQEGRTDVVISLPVTGNVPHYNVTCKKDDGPLPDGVELFGSSLTLQGPLELQHAGLYECFFSYHHVKANLTIRVTVKPQRMLPVAPTIGVDFRTEDGHRLIECSAADAVPAANMSWLLPEGSSGVSWFNFTSHNGSHSVRGVLLLPACSPWELTAECVINHPAFEGPANRSITLPPCARPEITINSSTEWTDGEEFTKVDCSVESVAPAATVRWHVGNSSSIGYLSATEVRPDGSVRARSSARVPSSSCCGQNVTCTVEHPSLEAPEKRTMHILLNKAPLLAVSLVRQQESPLWLAVCDYSGGGVGPDLAWVLPENAKGQTSLHSEHEGCVIKARLTYQFPLALHEGQDLTCAYLLERGVTEKKTIHIPRYYISSVRVLNHTTRLQSRYVGETITRRLALEENHHNQRVLLRVEGNVPEYNLVCERSDGAFAQMEGDAMVFQSRLTERDEGLYSCRASFYHHTATVHIQVEFTSEKQQLALAVVVGLSSALAGTLVLVLTSWVCCKIHSRSHYKKKESLAALTSLMQEPGSPEVKKSAVTENKSEEYGPMVSYSIVFDIKSTV
nr:uncharacterized protein si:ch211-149e23.4 [Gasterosteus aculeatus aculeatus]